MPAALVVASLAPQQSPSSEASAGFQPELPIAAAVFYPWYPSHWTAGPYFPITNYTPELGFYSSTDDAIIEQQLLMAEQAHLEAFISSWWGPDDASDPALQDILSVTDASGSPIRWAAYYEDESSGNPAASQIAADLNHLASTAFQSPAYLRVGGKPVLFVYDAGGSNCTLADRWLDAQLQSGVDVYLSLKVLPDFASCASQPESWHEYDPSRWAYQYLPHSVSISPGFWKYLEQPSLARNPEYFALAVDFAVRRGASWVLITTWNEWIEGTTVEPALEYGRTYLDLLCLNLPGPAPCAAGSQTQTATPPVTAPPTPQPPTATPPGATATPTAASPTSPGALPTPTVPGATLTSTPPTTAKPPPGPTLTPAATAAPTQTPRRTDRPLKRGDVDCSDHVDSVDALEILRMAVARRSGPARCSTLSLTEAVIRSAADTDCSGDVDTVDTLATLRFVIGLSVHQNQPCTMIGDTTS